MTRIDRRRFLGGAGALVALPLFESLPALAQESGAPPQRLICYFVPNGLRMQVFTPEKEGKSYVLTPTLEPLAPFKQQSLILSGLASAPGQPDEGGGDHASGTGSFLSARHCKRTEGQDIVNGVSVDQVVAGQIGGATRFGSIQLGLEGGSSVGGCDFGYSCAYLRNVSWVDESTPLPKMINPQLVFDRFFAGADATASAEQIAMRRHHRRSVLDYVAGEAKRLQPRLGAGDKVKLDSYLTSVREVELAIEALANAPVCDAPGYPAPQLDIEAHARVMADLMVIALKCDLTRVASFMFANGFSERHYAFLGVTEGHHALSHHSDKPEAIAQLELIDRWEVVQLAYLLEKLAAVEEADGSTLLDNTLVYWSSEMSDGNSHDHFGIPVILAGGGASLIKGGRHVVYPDKTPMANLFVSMLQAFGVATDAFGDDGTAPLTHLT